jgi:hypothetical protein
VAVWRKPKITFSPVTMIPRAMTQLVLGAGLAVEEQCHELVAVEAALLRLLELLGAGLDKPTGDGGGAEPEGLRNRLGAGLVVLTAQAQQDPPEQAYIGGPRRLELLVRGQGDLRVAREISDPLVGDGGLLLQKLDRAGLAHQRT